MIQSTDPSTSEQILCDVEEMIRLVKSDKYYGPYGVTMVGESGDLIDFLIDKDGNVVYDHSDSE